MFVQSQYLFILNNISKIIKDKTVLFKLVNKNILFNSIKNNIKLHILFQKRAVQIANTLHPYIFGHIIIHVTYNTYYSKSKSLN